MKLLTTHKATYSTVHRILMTVKKLPLGPYDLASIVYRMLAARPAFLDAG